MNKLTKLSRENKKLFNEIVVLVILAVVFIGFIIWNSASKQLAPTTTPNPPIKTDFNTDSLEQIRKTESNNPNLSPGRVGKPNPFAL